MKKNGLKLIEIDSTVTRPFESKADESPENVLIANIKEKSFAVVWLDYKVLIGTWDGKGFQFYDNKPFKNKYLQRMRVFNKDREMLIYRTGNGFKGRLRIDDKDGKGIEVIVAKQVLFGTKGASCNDSYTEITEKRGTSLVLPFGELNVDDKEKRIKIKTHNYIDYNAVKQATYVDCRFVEFIYENNANLNKQG
ncbi:MAG: TIGR03984 family CRISPR-associated protein [Deltaproteobacteria bacterium]|nr:TIGR03984 family CRISPR-associated protein [Deltaproteobacteria bacterium]